MTGKSGKQARVRYVIRKLTGLPRPWVCIVVYNNGAAYAGCFKRTQAEVVDWLNKELGRGKRFPTRP